MTALECLPLGVDPNRGDGICMRMRLGPHRVLFDCGLKDVTPLFALIEKEGLPDVILCSHAHPDHAQGLWSLHQAYPQIPIYGSEVTTQLLPLNWPHINPQATLALAQALPWRSPLDLREGLRVQLWPAGHLPGGAAFLLTYSEPEQESGPLENLQTENLQTEKPQRSYTVFYTGDFLLSNGRLVEGFPLEELRGLRPDVLLVEGSYGTTRHPHRRQQENQLIERLSQAIAQGQSVLLLTPALGLGQELLMLLRSHHQFTGQDVDIWVGGTVARGCDTYLSLLHHLPASVQNFARHQPLFWDDRIRPRVRRLPPVLHDLSWQNPCILVTDKPQHIVDYCALGERPAILLLPQQPHLTNDLFSSVVLDPLDPDAQVQLQEALQSQWLQVEDYLLGDHCDGAGTTQLIHNLRPQHIIFFHGSSTYLADLASLEELNSRYHVHIPSVLTSVELPIGETFIQPAAPETRYQGEINEPIHDPRTDREPDDVITITFPASMTLDAHWGQLADTGLIEARWQGEELVLRSLSQRELLHQQGDRLTLAHLECCGHCQHYRSQRCWNQGSPLYGFKVTAEGYCPAFEPMANAAGESA